MSNYKLIRLLSNLQQFQNQIEMNKRLIILSILFSLLLFNAFTAQQTTGQQTPATHVASAHRKQFQAKDFVAIDKDHFYQYIVVTENGQLKINIVSQDNDHVCLNFTTDNLIRFVDAYQNIILVKQVDDNENILSYYVLQILYDTNTDVFTLDSFAVNAYVDNQFFKFGDGCTVNDTTYPFTLTQILQYNQQQGWISVINYSGVSLSVYKINVAQKLNTLLTVGWFQVHGEVITGGNTETLYDQNGNQFLIDQHNCRTGFVQSVYDKVPISSLTKLPLYKKNQVFNMIGPYFQYVSYKKNGKRLTSFLYSNQTVGKINMKSKSSIKYYYDQYNYFVALSDCDIYLSNVYYDSVTSSFKVFTNTLKNTVKKESVRNEIYCDWNNAIEIVFIVDKFFILTQDKFLVYGTDFCKLYETGCIVQVSKQCTPTQILFREIIKYNIKLENQAKLSQHK